MIDAVHRAIDELNQMQRPDIKIEKSLGAKLAASSGQLDSIGQVNFIVETEGQIKDDRCLLLILSRVNC